MKHFLYILLAALTFAACSTDENNSDPEPPKHKFGRTVLVYAAARNSLGHEYNRERPTSNFHKDSVEIMNGAKYIPKGDRMLVFVSDDLNPRLYEISNSDKTPRLVRRWTDHPLATDVATMEEVISYVAKEYPSDDYGLVLWSHATGWIPSGRYVQDQQSKPASLTPPVSVKSFGIDVGEDGDSYNDRAVAGQMPYEMELDDLKLALKAGGVKFNYILFDCCLMQNIEVIYALRDAADYILGAPMSISAEGGFYTDLLQKGFFSSDVRDIAETYYHAINGDSPLIRKDPFGIAISVVRTDRLEAFARAMKFDILPLTSLVGRKSPDLSGVLYYHLYQSKYFYRPHNYDIRMAMKALLEGKPEVYARFCNALDEILVARFSTESVLLGSQGFGSRYADVPAEAACISMLIPQDIYSYNASVTRAGDYNEQIHYTEWYEACGMAATGW